MMTQMLASYRRDCEKGNAKFPVRETEWNIGSDFCNNMDTVNDPFVDLYHDTVGETS